MKAMRSSIACLAVLAFLSSFAATAEEQTPFRGAPESIPGQIQAEYFNNGGEGIAYHDVDPRNNIDYIRVSDVDIDRDTNTPPGPSGTYYVGWTEAGEWLNYTVNVAASGYYMVDTRVASFGQGGSFHIEFDGVNKTGAFVVPDTGDWRNWVVLRKRQIYLEAGQHLMRIAMDEVGPSGSIGNIDWVQFIREGDGRSPFNGTPALIPVQVRAVDFDNGGEGIAYHDFDLGNNGGAYRATDVDIDGTIPSHPYVGWTKAGEWLEYTVNVVSAGFYNIQAWVASQGSGGTFHIEFDRVDRTGSFVIPDTGGWRNFLPIGKEGIYLDAGVQVMRIALGSNGATGSVGNIEVVYFFNPSDRLGTIPGLIEAEDFDNGGEGVAYHDTDIGNNGSGRQTDVDLAQAGFYQNHKPNDALGWTKAGEWVQYTVDVQTAGYYRVDARVASEGQGGTFHIEFDGVDKTGTFTVPDTGGWSNYNDLSKRDIFLPAGRRVMRLVMDNVGPTGSVGNIDWVRFVSMQTARRPYWGSPPDLPAHIQAEDFDEGGEGVSYHDVNAGNAGNYYRPLTDVDIDRYDSLPSSSAYVGWTQAGGWLEYTVNVPAEGSYQVRVSVASQGQGGTFHIEFDGVDKTGGFTVPDTGGWRNFVDVSRGGIYLTAGLHVMRLALDSVGPSGSVANFDFIEFTKE